jgi:cytochrome c5
MAARSTLLGAGLALLVGAGPHCAAADPTEAYARFADDPGHRGRSVWLGTCRACHGDGFADAPAVTDRAAWAPRVAKGRPVLYAHALEGFFGPQSQMMPARGGNPALSDEEVRLAVDYMVRLVTRQSCITARNRCTDFPSPLNLKESTR